VLVPDVNLLLYAYDDAAKHHAAAKAWLEESLSGEESVGFAWVVLMGYVRISTNPRVYSEPLGVDEALDVVESWLRQDVAVLLYPDTDHLMTFRRLLEPLGAAGNLTTDAHLAALAIEHRATLISYDNDFSRFPGLRWRTP
jgi:uncharacterized protein